MKKSRHYILLAAVALIGLGSAFAYAEDHDGKEAVEGVSEYQQFQQAKITAVEAIQKAQAAHPDMKVSGVDFETEDGAPAFSVEFLSDKGETEVTVNAVTGEIMTEND